MKYRLIPILVVFACGFSVPVTAQPPRYARVISQNANLRNAPSVTSDSTQEVAEETLVKVLDEKLPWYVVRVGNRVGWMHGNTLEFISTQESVSDPPTEQTVVPDYIPSAPSVPQRERSRETPARSTAADRGYIRGPRGGCYYISSSGRKVYVDRSLCN